MNANQHQELVEVTQRLLQSIASGDWTTYCELCDPTLTAFEPEAVGHLVAGMDFHKFYFDNQAYSGTTNTTMNDIQVRLLGDDVALVNYVRLVQKIAEGNATTAAFEETRVWQKQDGQWKHVHFHRSAA